MICHTPFLPVGFGVPALQELLYGPIQLPTTTAAGRSISFGMNIKEKDMQSGDGRLFRSGELSEIVWKALGTTWESASQVCRNADISTQHLSGVRYALFKHVKEGTAISVKRSRQTFYKRKP